MDRISVFKKIAFLEGLSYLLLVFVAMPFKYFADMPLGVKYVGWAHGLLFILYIAFFLLAWQQLRWKFSKALVVGMASLLPFAPFFVERNIEKKSL